MRLQNNILTHGDFLSPLESFRLPSKTANAILTAAVTTVLAYQLTALAFNLLLGRRQHGQTLAHDIHIQLLTDEPSPLSIAAAVFRCDFLDRLRFHPDIPRGAHLSRSTASIPKHVLCKLVLLLLAAPVFNLLCIIATLEFDDTLSFADADFGGLALGFNQDLSTLALRDHHQCSRMNFVMSSDLRSHARIYRCRIQSLKVENATAHEPGVTLSVASASNGSIEVRAQGFLSRKLKGGGTHVSKKTQMFTVYAFISADGEQFRIAHRLEMESLKQVMAFAQTEMQELPAVCNVSVITGPVESAVSENGVVISQHYFCPTGEQDQVSLGLDTVFNVSNLVTLVEADTIRWINASQEPEPGDDLPFLIRRRSFVNLGVLCLTAFVAFALRLLTRIFMVNDVENKIEGMLKRFLCISWYDSVLLYDHTFDYNHTSYIEKELHYGVLTPSDGYMPSWNGDESSGEESFAGTFDP